MGKWGFLVFLLLIVANALVSQRQKAKAEEERRRRLVEEAGKKPAVPVPSPAAAQPRATTIGGRRAPAPREIPRGVLAKPRQAPQKTSWPQDLIREWTRRLEEALEPFEGPPEIPPESTRAAAPTAPPPSAREAAPATPPRPAPPRPSRPSVAPKPTSSTAFLGRLHRDPLVNAIILSEVLSRPVGFREDRPNLLH
jgi:hypothetical protein